jgi:hypothetical protein
VVRDGAIVLIAGDEQAELVKLAQVPVLADSADAQRLDSVLGAVAAAWSLGVTQVLMRAGLTTLEPELANSKDVA